MHNHADWQKAAGVYDRGPVDDVLARNSLAKRTQKLGVSSLRVPRTRDIAFRVKKRDPYFVEMPIERVHPTACSAGGPAYEWTGWTLRSGFTGLRRVIFADVGLPLLFPWPVRLWRVAGI